MRRNEERQEVLVVLVDVPAEQPRQDHAVPEARHREELGDSLEEPEDDRPRVGDQREENHAVEARFGPERNQAKAKQASPTRSEAIPCLVWWWFEPAWWPGKKPGSDFAGSAK